MRAGRGGLRERLGTINAMATFAETIEEIEQEIETPEDASHGTMYNVVLLNDDFHTDAYVVEMLGKLFCLPVAQSFRHALEVDTTGRTIVMTCEKEQAEFARDQIHAYGADPRMVQSKGSMSAIIEPAAGSGAD